MENFYKRKEYLPKKGTTTKDLSSLNQLKLDNYLVIF